MGLLASCGGSDDSRPTPTPTTPPGTQPASPTAASTPSPTPTQAGPTLEEMVGQMLMLGFRGTELSSDNPILADLRDRNLGGVVLFSQDVPSGGGLRNIESPRQLADLTAALQEAATTPLLVAVDEEGGKVARLGPDHGFPATRSAAELGRIDDVALTRTAAAEIASTLTAAGINLNLAPVVDLNTNPENPIIGALDRSFGASPDLVTRHAEAFIDSHHDRGLLTALKHFPGHGSSRADSHLGFVDVTDTWNRVELEPFRAIIAAGKADLVMVAHLFNRTLNPDYPASLSEATIGGLLRGQLGFQGIVISDDMEMGAITQNYGFEDALRLAINAGNDILVFGNNLTSFDPELGRRAFDTILRLVRSGDISPDRITEAHARLTALKRDLP